MHSANDDLTAGVNAATNTIIAKCKIRLVGKNQRLCELSLILVGTSDSGEFAREC